MISRIFLLWLAIAFAARAAVQIDDTYQQVIDQNGTPIGKMQSGDSIILRYADQTVRLKAGKVVSVELAAPSTRATPAAQTATPPRPVKKVAPTPTIPPKPLEWTTDYGAALVAAKEQNRKVFLFFTGSDWCGWCMRLNREILSTPDFARYAAENLILVEIDFPRAKTQVFGLKKQNTNLQRAFEVTGFPTVMILDASGKAVGKLGYQEGGPAPFIKRLEGL